MIRVLQYHFTLWKLQRNKNHLEKLYTNLITKSRKNPKYPDEEEELYGEWRCERDVIDFEINSIITHRLISTANKLMLPVPSYTDKEAWIETYGNYKVLSPKGMTDVRSSIRKERKEKHEQLRIWASLMIGFIGALTGLLAIILQ